MPAAWDALSVCRPTCGEPDGAVPESANIVEHRNTQVFGEATPGSFWNPPQSLYSVAGHLQLNVSWSHKGTVRVVYLPPYQLLVPRNIFRHVHHMCFHLSKKPLCNTSRWVRLISNNVGYRPTSPNSKTLSKEVANQWLISITACQKVQLKLERAKHSCWSCW